MWSVTQFFTSAYRQGYFVVCLWKDCLSFSDFFNSSASLLNVLFVLFHMEVLCVYVCLYCFIHCYCYVSISTLFEFVFCMDLWKVNKLLNYFLYYRWTKCFLSVLLPTLVSYLFTLNLKLAVYKILICLLHIRRTILVPVNSLTCVLVSI